MSTIFGEETPAAKALGDRLKTLRLGAGLSGTQLAARLPGKRSQGTVSRWEAGKVVPDLEQIQAWANVTQAPAAILAELTELLAEATGERASWASLRQATTPADVQKLVADMERRAGSIHVYQPLIIPGLLQAADVARQKRLHRYPDSPRADLEAHVQGVIARQAILFNPTKRLQFVTGEIALRWLALPPAIVVQQAAQLAAMSTLPNVDLGILAADRPMPAWGTHGFVLYDDLDGDGHGLVHLELRHGPVNVIGKPVQIYRDAFAQLLDAALTGEQAQELLVRIQQDLLRP